MFVIELKEGELMKERGMKAYAFLERHGTVIRAAGLVLITARVVISLGKFFSFLSVCKMGTREETVIIYRLFAISAQQIAKL